MTQDEAWLKKYLDVMTFIKTNHRNPSKYYDEEKLMVHFLKRGRKLMNAGELQELRLGKFMELLELCEQNKHKNQYEYNNNTICLILTNSWFDKTHHKSINQGKKADLS